MPKTLMNNDLCLNFVFRNIDGARYNIGAEDHISVTGASRFA